MRSRLGRGARHLAASAAALLGALASVAPQAPAVAAATARGTVFEDRDGDGARDADEPGVPDVRVSNGLDVVATDADGRWSLSVEGDTVLFAVKPSDWTVPVDANQLPRFHYVHAPEGSPPGLRYRGLAPSGPLPASIDFPLRRRPEPRRFEAILIADPQPQTEAELDMLRDDVVVELIGTKALFGMTLGDILFDDLSLFPRYNAVIGRIGIPWYNVPGNHELNLRAPDDAHSLETFKRVFGPPYYAFDVGDAHFVVLDNIFYRVGGESDPADLRGSGGYEARIGKRQLAWLENDLRHVPRDRLVVLAMHAPLETRTGEPDNPRSNTQDRRDLFRLLRGREHLYAVAGHTHTTEHHYFGREDGFPGPGELHHHVLATASGSWWSGPLDERGIATAVQRDGTPNGWHVLEVDGAEARVRYRAAGAPPERQMRILFDVAHHAHRPEATRDARHGALLDGRFSRDALAAAELVVNLFDGGPRSRVSFTVAGRPPIEMTRRLQIDPSVAELYARHRETVKPWVQATPSTHVFVADLPDDLAPGTWTVTVRAVDEFGRVHHGHRLLELTEGSAP